MEGWLVFPLATAPSQEKQILFLSWLVSATVSCLIGHVYLQKGKGTDPFTPDLLYFFQFAGWLSKGVQSIKVDLSKWLPQCHSNLLPDVTTIISHWRPFRCSHLVAMCQCSLMGDDSTWRPLVIGCFDIVEATWRDQLSFFLSNIFNKIGIKVKRSILGIQFNKYN